MQSEETPFDDTSKSQTNLVEKQGSPTQARPTLYLALVSIVCFAGSSLQFGYNLVVINAPQKAVERFYSKSINSTSDSDEGVENFSTIWSVVVSIFAIGGMCGAFIGPHIAKSIGRKYCLFWNNILAIAGGILLFVTKYAGANVGSVAMLIIGRILLGVNAGINTSVAPMYLSELAPVALRGALGTLNQFGIVSGILLGNILGLSELLGTDSGWHIAFGITAIIAFFQMIALPFCPESPRYLIAIRDNEFDASTALQKLRGVEDVSQEIEEIKADAAAESTLKKVSVMGLLQNRVYWMPLLISVVLQLSQQLSGIGGILYYSTKMFGEAGLPDAKAQAATCGVGALSVVMTIIVIFLVEVKGRRFLMLMGLGGMTFFYIIVTIAFYFSDSTNERWATILAVVAILASVTLFQLGPGAIPWFIVAELFNQASISAAISIAGATNWFGNFLVGIVFPELQKLYPYTFIPFIVLLVLFFLFILFFVPETKGLTLAEIQAKLRKSNSPTEEDESKPFLSPT